MKTPGAPAAPPDSRSLSRSLPVTDACTIRIVQEADGFYPYCAFICVLKGEISFSFGGEPILHRRSDFFFLPSDRPWHASALTDSSILVLGLDTGFVQDYLDLHPLPFLSTALLDSWDAQKARRLVISVSELYREDPEAYCLAIRGQVFLLLSELRQAAGSTAPSVPGRYAERIQRIADYIDRHYAENLTLPDLAAAFYLTPQYLSTFFKEHFSSSFKSWLTERRLFYSLRDLRHTHLTISEIALRNGFASVSAYRKNFEKAYGCAPSDWRTAYLAGSADPASPGDGRGVSPEAAPRAGISRAVSPEAPSPAAAPEEASSPDRRSGAPLLPSGREKQQAAAEESLVLSAAAEGRPLPRANRMINAGSAFHLLSERFRLQLLSFCRTMQLSHVRLEEMVSNRFIPPAAPAPGYLYRNADTVLTFFYENDLTPFLELTGISSAEVSYLPRDEAWYERLESFLKHVTRRWPASWLSQWKFEMWMLPRDNAASYIKALIRVTDLVKAYIPEAAVGGPGYDPCVHMADPAGLIAEFRKQQFTPSFFSASLSFAVRGRDGGLLISKDPLAPEKACRRIRGQLASMDASLPLYITRWSSAVPETAPITATCYQAAFLARSWLMLDENSDLAAYDLFYDLELPSESHAEIYSFGRGLFASGFVPYAPYYAYAMCSSMGGEYLAGGASFRFVRAEANRYQLLVCHYEHFRTSAGPEVENILDFDHVYEFFEDAPPQALSVEITDLTPGLWRVTRTVLDREHGSLLDIMIGEYRDSGIDSFEFLKLARMVSSRSRSYRAASCLPRERSSYREVKETLRLHVLLPPHTVCLWDIRKIV